MGSNCSSLSKRNGKKDKEKDNPGEEDNDNNGQLNGRKTSDRSAESLPYGDTSPPATAQSVPEESVLPKSENKSRREAGPPAINVAVAKDDSRLLSPPPTASPCPPSIPASPSPCPSSQAPSPVPSSVNTSPNTTLRAQPMLSPGVGPDSRPVSESTSPEKTESVANQCYTQLFSIKDDNNNLIAISYDSNELLVWSVYEERAVRTLRGISQPRNVKMVDRYRAVVLCNRELKLYNLNSGTLETKLKGVMNQKMPYYGLHDDKYVVALSRNRMYVNVLNISTGDLETTFKVGEDRFLNSLLVSANGQICVCGDETQKPFPLLVWDLANRKLLYDLRIPHHEFITQLSAISNDGHYVVSVCKEMNTSSPNSIIVYDLQSGTLFKKWKPESNSVSIAISTQSGCVINGVETGEVLVWDLSTGTKKHTLSGHTAPPDVLQATENYNLFLSYDSSGSDQNIRIWELDSGTCLMVYTPDSQISCCRLTPDGKALVFGFLSSMTLKTVLLNQKSSENTNDNCLAQYGDTDKDGNVFDLKA